MKDNKGIIKGDWKSSKDYWSELGRLVHIRQNNINLSIKRNIDILIESNENKIERLKSILLKDNEWYQHAKQITKEIDNMPAIHSIPLKKLTEAYLKSEAQQKSFRGNSNNPSIKKNNCLELLKNDPQLINSKNKIAKIIVQYESKFDGKAPGKTLIYECIKELEK
jgi:hypothetical protein